MSASQTLIEMGFSENSVKKALAATSGGVEQAMEWLLAHSDDPGIHDEPVQEEAKPADGMQSAEKTEADDTEGKDTSAEESGTSSEKDSPKSFKCDTCGKLFTTSEEVEFHAVKSGHTDFSESTEEKKPLTEEEKLKKKMELAQKIKQRRKEREQIEEKESRDREKKRIQMGQQIAEMKRTMAEDEMKRIAEERKREKTEDKLARQRVKDQIEQDRLARKEMFANKGGGGGGEAAAAAIPKPQPTAQQTSQKKEYATTRLQVRLPSGTPLIQEFNAKESLSAVRLWVSLNRQDGLPADAPFKFCTSFPRKVYTDEDMDKPLDVLGLVPSAVLMVTK